MHCAACPIRDSREDQCRYCDRCRYREHVGNMASHVSYTLPNMQRCVLARSRCNAGYPLMDICRAEHISRASPPALGSHRRRTRSLEAAFFNMRATCSGYICFTRKFGKYCTEGAADLCVALPSADVHLNHSRVNARTRVSKWGNLTTMRLSRCDRHTRYVLYATFMACP